MMRRILAIVMGIFLSAAVCGTASAIPMSNTDLWDISQGTTIIGSTPCQISPSNMFGNISGTTEPSNTIFGDQEIVSWVEWRTPEPITSAAFNLVASHDDRPTDIYQIRLRGFSHFRLYTGDGQGDWNLIYEYITDPDGDGWYGGGGINYRQLTQLLPSISLRNFASSFQSPKCQDRAHESKNLMVMGQLPSLSLQRYSW